MLKPNKDYSGDTCYKCEALIAEGKLSQEEIDREHGECHGWYHCGGECCGECFICGY